MKIKEIITEARIDPELYKAIIAKGYTFVGNGVDQHVYLAPNGTILKIFNATSDSTPTQFGIKHQSFVDFVDYCTANSDNPFLPQFSGWERFEFGGNYYLRIRCERLFDLTEYRVRDVARFLEDLSVLINSRLAPAEIIAALEYGNSQYPTLDITLPAVQKAISLIGGKKELLLMLNTIDDLRKIANSRGYYLDLHSGNFMLGSDGHIVINDPFYVD